VKRAAPARLGGVHEVAELLGISKPALAERRLSSYFPKALVELRCGPIWDLDEIEEHERWQNRQPGRRTRAQMDRYVRERHS
jgi:hypothetical protein